MSNDDRRTKSWLDAFVEYTDEQPSPQVFRRWAGASAIASALQRRCHCRVFGKKLFPNLYIALIGGPGSGKSVAIDCAKAVVRSRLFKENVFIAADSTTRESFFQQMTQAQHDIKYRAQPNNALDLMDQFDESPISIMSSELGTFLGTKNMDFIRALADLFDTDRDDFTHKVKTSESSIIQRPWVNIIGGTTPSDLSEILPRSATNQGFTSRLLLIWCDEEYEPDDLFAESEDGGAGLRNALMHDYTRMLEMAGEFRFSTESAAYINAWNKGIRKESQPRDVLLQHYNKRRTVHMLKLCMVVSASNHQSMIIENADIDEASAMLLEAEKHMPKALKGVGGNENADIVTVGLDWLYEEYRAKKKPVRGTHLRSYLHRFVPMRDVRFYLNHIQEYCMVEGDYPDDNYIPLSVKD